MMRLSTFIGFDPRPAEVQSFAIARESILANLSSMMPVRGLVLSRLRAQGLYTRKHERRDGRLFDTISQAPMSTEFAISRFLTPHLAGEGWALFMDADMMVRGNLHRLFDLADPSKAVMVVKHDYRPEAGTKMDGQAQQQYGRKNWSSVMLFNCDHPAVKALTPDVVNTARGLWLHQFGWLDDDMIGELPPEWNWLVGHSSRAIDPKIVHFTEGVPSMPGYENVPYADEWWRYLERWAER